MTISITISLSITISITISNTTISITIFCTVEHPFKDVDIKWLEGVNAEISISWRQWAQKIKSRGQKNIA